MSRLNFVDSSRGLAVVLAMLSHALLQFSANVDVLETVRPWISIVTRSATPTFMILFGIMIEVAYLRKLREGSALRTVQTRLLARAITCYALFVCITVAAFATGKLGGVETFKALSYQANGRFGTILKIYAVLFLLILVTLPLARRFGAWFFLGFATVAWIVRWVAMETDLSDLYVLHFLIGHAKGFGPAILVGMTFVAFGMAIGEALTGRSKWRLAAILLSGAVLQVAWSIGEHGYMEWMVQTVKTYRWINDPVYFAYGIVACALCLAIFALWHSFAAIPAPTALDTLGRDTLLFYGGGNIVINLLPYYGGTAVWGALMPVAFLLFLIWATFRKVQVFELSNQYLFNLPNRILTAYIAMRDRIVAVLMPSTQRQRPRRAAD